VVLRVPVVHCSSSIIVSYLAYSPSLYRISQHLLECAMRVARPEPQSRGGGAVLRECHYKPARRAECASALGVRCPVPARCPRCRSGLIRYQLPAAALVLRSVLLLRQCCSLFSSRFCLVFREAGGGSGQKARSAMCNKKKCTTTRIITRSTQHAMPLH
jgi:hypothetical protein